MQRILTLVLTLNCLTTVALASDKSTKIIYGIDDRIETKDASRKLQQLAHSTAVMVTKNEILTIDSKYKMLPGVTLQKQRMMCKGERFTDQPTTGLCSGFLVGPDLLVTAGHCVKTASDCKNITWVFDFKVKENGKVDTAVNKDKVFGCKKIISAKLDAQTMDDYALIQLDRVATGRRALNIRENGLLEKGAKVVVIGHPSGLPQKVTDNGTVRTAVHKNYFVTDLDTFGGNSGSAVFNKESSAIEGILVRGDRDYVYDEVKRCYKVNVCKQNSCGGESVTKITTVPELAVRSRYLRAAMTGSTFLLDQYLKMDFDKNIYDNEKNTALHLSVAGRHVLATKSLLLSKKIDVNAKNIKGQTAFQIAKANKDQSSMFLLLAAGANKDL
jgi:hypothetical protein